MEQLNLENLSVDCTRWNDEDGWRIYEIHKQKYISVTQVLSYFVDFRLKNWFIRTSKEDIEKKKTDTAKAGSDIHARAEKGEEDRLATLMASLEMFSIKKEFVVKSKFGWAGSVDLYANFKGKKYLLDIKTGNFGDVASQLGAYSLAAAQDGMKVDGIGVISLPRDESKEASFYDYSAHLEENQFAWCCGFEKFKHHYYKKLKDYSWFNSKSVLEYNWGFYENSR